MGNGIELRKQWWGVDKAQARADRRLELLREIEEQVSICPLCKRGLRGHLGEYTNLADGHADDCKLAKELANDNA